MNNNIIRNGNGTEYKDQNRVSRVCVGAIESERMNPVINTGVLFDKKIVPEYIPTRLAATILGISENALRIKVCRGQIPVLKFGRSLRFQISEVTNFLHQKGENYGD